MVLNQAPRDFPELFPTADAIRAELTRRQTIVSPWDLDLPHNQLIVLLALSEGADGSRRVAAGIEYVAWKTGYNRTQVVRVLNDLIRPKPPHRPLLRVVERGGGRGKKTVFELCLDNGRKKSPFVAPVERDSALF